jgi:MFS family permease
MRTVVRDICPDKNQMAKFGAILGVIMPLASSIAPILGGYIEEYLNWRWSFVFLFVYILGFLIYSYKNYQETNNNPLTSPFTSVFYDYLEIIRNKRFFCYNLTSAFAVCSVFSYLTVSSYLLQIVVKLTPEQFGYSNVLIALTLIGSSYLNGLLIHRKGIDKLLKRGTLFLATGGLLFFTAGVFNFINIYTVLIPLVIITLGCGFIYPNASAGGLSLFANNAGTASAVYACIQMIGASLGSGIISLLTHNFNHHMLFLGLIILCQGLIGSYLAKKLVSLKQQN